jgi:hypothetical protein
MGKNIPLVSLNKSGHIINIPSEHTNDIYYFLPLIQSQELSQRYMSTLRHTQCVFEPLDRIWQLNWRDVSQLTAKSEIVKPGMEAIMLLCFLIYTEPHQRYGKDCANELYMPDN